ncbi:EAL and modified HD-GYP domain-containing signal transduction protein [Marinospirillum celere]|uniref:EAL and modified HD-GYP domain-containing signal transduction protein n=1 Tax=Marinospirillum celere TaxID=1122252 RepID=A0A1I1FR89_9GAMM|nr:HDOD domain-containing protein [Marinospirillum celere]SFC00118.1 EAL and modified HD-GYP domain-containing signal transduction protein [Marinospirillum celere]
MSKQLLFNNQAYCVALQPICNAELRHQADELLYRAASNEQAARIDDHLMATARVCHTAFYELGLEKLVGQRELFFIAPREWVLHPENLPPPTGQLVIEVLDPQPDADLLAALKNLRQLGYRVALAAFAMTPQNLALLEVVDVIKVDLLKPLDTGQLAEFKSRGLQLLARRVEDWTIFERCRELGFDYFQGYFYARPEVTQAATLERSGNRSAQIRILAEIQAPEPDYRVLEPLIAQDPHLAFLLLKLTNSPLYRRRSEVTTIHQALNTLGLDRVKSLVTTVMLANNGAANRLSLPKALTRAAMCERLAASVSGVGERQAFMAGLMSMMDLLMGMPMQDLLQELPLSSDFKAALVSRAGRLGQLLSLVQAFEQAKMSGKSSELIERLNRVWLESQIWVNQILMEVD